jgi:hypothetical protein
MLKVIMAAAGGTLLVGAGAVCIGVLLTENAALLALASGEPPHRLRRCARCATTLPSPQGAVWTPSAANRREPELASHQFVEATGSKQSRPDLGPPWRWKLADQRSDSIALRQGHMIEVERAHHRHSVVGAKYNFGVEAADSAGHGNDDQLPKTIDELGSSEDQDRSAFVR